MADGVNAFTVYSSLELQINEFVQQLNRASQILDQTLQNMSGAVSSLNMPAVNIPVEQPAPVSVQTEIVPPDIFSVEIPSEIMSPDMPDMPVATPFSVPSEIENPDSPTLPQEQTYTLHTETEPLEQVTVPPPDDRTFLQKIKDGFSNLQNAVKSVAGHFKNTENAAEEMGQTVSETSENGKKSMSQYKSDVMKLAAQYRRSGMEQKEAMEKAYRDIDKSEYDFTQNSKKHSKETGNNWTKIGNVIINAFKSIPSKIGSGLKTIGTGISDAFKSGVENAKNALKELPEKASEALKETGEKLKGIAEKVAKAGTVAIGAVSAGVTVGLKKSVDAGMDFDSAMSQVAATMGKTTDEITGLRDFAKEMGRTTAFSATESAEALNYMALAGYDAETSMSMLPNVLNLASAGNMDLALASDMITDSQSALGLSLDETTQLVDKMAKASSKSNTSVSQLGDAILTVGGTAKKLKGGTTELATVLGILADNGIKGSEGGTALRNIMNSLISPTEDAMIMLDQMGASLYDSEGNMRSLNDVFTDLRNGMSGLATQAEKDQVLTTIFNSRDLKSAEALIANVGDRFNELSSAIDASAGAADAMGKTQLDNLAGDVTLFQSALEGAEIAVSDLLTPALRDFVRTGTDGISKIASVLDSSVNLDEALDKLFPAIQPYIDKLIGQVLSAIPKVIDVAVKLIGILGKAIVKNAPKLAQNAVLLVRQFAESIAENAPSAIQGFAEMFERVKGWIISNSRNLITAGMSMVKSIADGISDNLPDIIGSVTDIITFLATQISQNAGDLIDSGLKILTALGKGIIENLPELVGAALDIVTSLGSYLIDKIPVLKDKAPEIVESLATALSECGDKMVTAADELITKFADTIGLSEQWENLKTTIGGAFNKIRDSVSGSIDKIQESFENMKESLSPIIETISTKLNNFKNKLIGSKDKSGLLEKAIDKLSDIISDIIEVFADVVTGIMDFVTWLNSGTTGAYILKTAIEAVATAISITLIGGAIKALIAQIPILLGHIVAQTAALAANAAAWIAAAAPILGIVAAISAVIFVGKLLIENWDEIKTFCIGVWNEMQDRLIAFWEDLDIGWHAIWDSITGFFKERIDDLKTGWQSITNFFKERIDDLSVGVESIRTFFTGLRDHIKRMFGAIGRFISGLVDNWISGKKSIEEGVDNIKEKIGELPEKFGELVTGALNWGKDLIENFMQGAKEKIEEWNSFWEDVGFTIYDLLHHSTPEKGPLKDDDKWGGDLMDNLINGVQSRTGELKSTVEKVAGNIKDAFEKPITVDTNIAANGHFNRLKVPDIQTVTENIHTVRYNPAETSVQKNSPVIVENLNLTIEGTNFNSEYETERFIDRIANRLQAKNITRSRGVGGAFY